MPGKATSGFTLIELIVIIMLVGILAVVAIPRFFGREFEERGFHDGVKAAVQHARRVAVASRRYVCVTTTPGVGAAGNVAVSMDTRIPEGNEANSVVCAVGGNTVAIALPAPGRGCAATNQVCAPNGVALGGANVIFDPLGRSVSAAKAVAAAVVSLAVSNEANITIQPETGLVQ